MTKNEKAEEHEGPSVRAVEAYNKAREALDEFMSDPDIRDILVEMEDLVNTYNRCLDDAVRAVKGEVKSSDKTKLFVGGLGAQKKFKRYYDAEFLANSLPAEQADEILTEKVVYDLDKPRLEQLLRQGEIDSEIVNKAYHEDEQNPVSMPGTPKPYVLPLLPVPE